MRQSYRLGRPNLRNPATGGKVNEPDALLGNAAKYYVQRRVVALLEARPHTVLVDVGCGDARKWDWLYHGPLADKVEFLGFDLDGHAIALAAQTKPRWQFFAEPAYDVKRRISTADIVVSFSTLEHVYRKREFIESAKSVMHDNSIFFLNYDNGHFFGWADWKRNIFGPLLAKLGNERYYQAMVWQEEIESLLRRTQLTIVEELNFHQATNKAFHRVFSTPEATRQYMSIWCDYELAVNRLLRQDPAAWAEASSNRYLLSKLFVLRVAG